MKNSIIKFQLRNIQLSNCLIVRKFYFKNILSYYYIRNEKLKIRIKLEL